MFSNQPWQLLHFHPSFNEQRPVLIFTHKKDILGRMKAKTMFFCVSSLCLWGKQIEETDWVRVRRHSGVSSVTFSCLCQLFSPTNKIRIRIGNVLGGPRVYFWLCFSLHWSFIFFSLFKGVFFECLKIPKNGCVPTAGAGIKHSLGPPSLSLPPAFN